MKLLNFFYFQDKEPKIHIFYYLVNIWFDLYLYQHILQFDLHVIIANNFAINNYAIFKIISLFFK
jgi:hypothetical protein